VRFSVSALATPEALPRVLGLFAQRGLVPCRVVAFQNGEVLAISIDVAGLDEGSASLVAARLGAITFVERVATGATNARRKEK
jgi:acetolactate synthase regulatory subunit